MNRMMQEYNNRGLDDFEGYSPEVMHRILHDPFGPRGPLSLQGQGDDYRQVPLVQQVRYLAELIRNVGELKLTQNGFLPVKVVAELYAQRIMQDDYLERSGKLYKETDSVSIQMTRLIMDICGIVKKRNNKLSLTAKGEKLLPKDRELFETLLFGFCKRFNWAYFDSYSDEQTGQLGYGFSLVLLAKYGAVKQTSEYYAAKYFRAFPMLLPNFSPGYKPLMMAEACYTLRSFKHFLSFFGLVEIEYEGRGFDHQTIVNRTALFDKLIGFTRP